MFKVTLFLFLLSASSSLELKEFVITDVSKELLKKLAEKHVDKMPRGYCGQRFFHVNQHSLLYIFRFVRDETNYYLATNPEKLTISVDCYYKSKWSALNMFIIEDNSTLDAPNRYRIKDFFGYYLIYKEDKLELTEYREDLGSDTYFSFEEQTDHIRIKKYESNSCICSTKNSNYSTYDFIQKSCSDPSCRFSKYIEKEFEYIDILRQLQGGEL